MVMSEPLTAIDELIDARVQPQALLQGATSLYVVGIPGMEGGGRCRKDPR